MSVDDENIVFIDNKCEFQRFASQLTSSEEKITELKIEISSEGYFEYMSFLLFGVVSLFSWTAVITQTSYFASRVRDSLKNSVGSMISGTSMVALLTGSFLNIGLFYKYKSKLKIISSLVLNTIGFFIIILIVKLEIDDILFITILLIITLIMNLLQPVMMSAFYEELRCYSPKCYNTFNFGIGSSYLISGFLLVILTPFNVTDKNSALIFISIALFFILLCLIIYIRIINSKLYKRSFDNIKNSKKDMRAPADKFRAMFKMFWRIWIDSISLILCYIITLFIYPVLLLSVKSVSENDTWKKYFHKVYVFLLFGLGEALGRYTYKIFPWPKPSQKSILLFAFSRFIFVILLLFCNRPEKQTQKIAFIMNDFFPCVISLLVAITKGHLASIVLSVPYTLTTDDDKVDGSRTLVLCISIGLAIGATSSFIVRYF